MLEWKQDFRAKMAMIGRKSASFTSANIDSLNGEASSLRVSTIADDAVIIDSEPERNGEFKRFVKLKKSHWVAPKQRRNCKLCMTDFGPKSKKLNCRRCGEVFCEKCCCYRRRLSPNCEPSANGHYYRVCYSCSDSGTQGFGQTRSLMGYFESQKAMKRISIMTEMKRLVDGFKANIRASRLESVVADTISAIKVPAWQMSEKWLESKEVEWCGDCSGKFTIFMQKHHCRVCGAVFCSKCSSQDLMLYYSDKGAAEWAIIRVVGCPDTEPNVCCYLRVCSQCREDAENLQVKLVLNTRAHSEEVRDKFGLLASVLDSLRPYQTRLNRDILFYQEMVEGLMDGQGKFKEVSESNQNVVKVFAKLQVDISYMLSEYATCLSNLKKVKMTSQKEVLLLRNVSHVHYNYYHTNMSTFKCFKEQLGKTVPADVLLEVQNYSDKHAIISTCITTRQLGLELLDICTRYTLDPAVAQRISQLEEGCSDELERIIRVVGEDWNECRGRLKAFVRQRFQSEKLIPLHQLADKSDSVAVEKSVRKRCFVVLSQVQNQLLAKASETKFATTKFILNGLVTDLEASVK